MSKATGYSLWLVPDVGSEVYRVLTRCIVSIAKEYQTPEFIPHVTLIGGVDGGEENVRNKTGTIAGILSTYEIQLGEVGSNGIYFQALFSKVVQTQPVIHANTVAQAVFGVDKGIYFPHSSFAYADFSQEIIANLKKELEEGQNQVTGVSFLVRGVELWRTEGVVKDWYRITTFPFTG